MSFCHSLLQIINTDELTKAVSYLYSGSHLDHIKFLSGKTSQKGGLRIVTELYPVMGGGGAMFSILRVNTFKQNKKTTPPTHQ